MSGNPTSGFLGDGFSQARTKGYVILLFIQNISQILIGLKPKPPGRHEALGTSSLIGQLFYFRCSGCINFIGSRLIGLI